MNDIKTCCKECYDRHPLCHSDCPKKAAQDALREEIKQKKLETVPCAAYSRERKVIIEKKVRRHKKK